MLKWTRPFLASASRFAGALPSNALAAKHLLIAAAYSVASLVALAALPAQAAELQPPGAGVCAEFDDPPDDGSTPTFPGLWTNPKRAGTGWHINYEEQSDKISLTWYTYDSHGRPVWLISDFTSWNSDGETASLELNYFTAEWDVDSDGDTIQPTIKIHNPLKSAEVAVRTTGDPSRLAIRWRWSEAGPAPYDECIHDFSRVGPFFGGAPRQPNAATTGAWYEPAFGGWGLFWTILQMPQDTGPSKYLEAAHLAVYADDGQPIWLQAVQPTPPTDQLPPVGALYPLRYFRSAYPFGVPTEDCSTTDCYSSTAVGTFARNWQSVERVDVAINVSGSAGVAPSTVTKFDRPSAWREGDNSWLGADAEPPADGFLPLGKISAWNQVSVDKVTCVIPHGESLCVITVNAMIYPYDVVKNPDNSISYVPWLKPGLVRHDVVANTGTVVDSNDFDFTYERVEHLSVGKRIKYFLTKDTDDYEDKAVAFTQVLSAVPAEAPPIASFNAPIQSLVYPVDTQLTFKVAASSPSGIERVEFYAGPDPEHLVLLGNGTFDGNHWTLAWQSSVAGAHPVWARAYSGSNDQVPSALVGTTITLGIPPKDVQVGATNGPTFDEIALIELVAIAPDPPGDRYIERVEFYINDEFKGAGIQASVDQWVFYWEDHPSGEYTVKAKAISNEGLFSWSDPLELLLVAPEVEMEVNTPLTGESVEVGDRVQLHVTLTNHFAFAGVTWATDPVGGGSGGICSICRPNNFGNWDPAVPGNYRVKATGLLKNGQVVTATSPSIEVRPRAPREVKLAPLAATVPLGGSYSHYASLSHPAEVRCVKRLTAAEVPASAADCAEIPGQTLCDNNQCPSLIPSEWPAEELGVHRLVVAALTQRDGLIVSPEAEVEVIFAPPKVDIVSPVSGSDLVAPVELTLTASVESQGPVDRVEFLVDGSLLGAVEQGAPFGSSTRYSLMWPEAQAGSYTIVARAIAGQQEGSDQVAITLQAPSATPLPPRDLLSDGVGASPGSFRVDESGAATYTMPLYAAPGTAGVAPALSLRYSSQSPEGSLGLGWSIDGVSAISRCRASQEAGDADAVNAPPLNFTLSDRFCLDGQRLVEVQGVEYPACQAVLNMAVRQYRTERESFQRVCAYSQAGMATRHGPLFFTVERRDGSLSWFGDRRSVSCLPDPLDPNYPDLCETAPGQAACFNSASCTIASSSFALAAFAQPCQRGSVISAPWT